MVKYTLNECDKDTGRCDLIGSADSIGRLAWERCDALAYYAVQRVYAKTADHSAGVVTLACFDGCDVYTVRAWLADHADYTGEAGCLAWKGRCDCCGRMLVDGECDCAMFGPYSRLVKSIV